jgi:putative membrane protein
MRIIINWFISAVAIAISAYLLPGVEVDSLTTALILAVVLGGINAFIRPILIVLTLPLTIFTFGLFILILNALLIMLYRGRILVSISLCNYSLACSLGPRWI